MSVSRVRLAALGAALASALVLAALVLAGAPARGHAEPRRHPNIIFVLTDDLSLNLLPYMPHVQALADEGMSFRNYFVSDSLCCPSRSSILTGNLPHTTGIFSNVGRDGGFGVFHARGEEQQTFAVRLQQAGYRTGFMGKYMNGYMEPQQSGGVADTYVPPGWDDWLGAGRAYSEFDYTLNDDGVLRSFGHAPSDYLTDVLADRAVAFIDRATADSRPFMLEVSTFAPHSPYTPAPRDADSFPGLRAPRNPAFDTLPARAPRWLSDHPRLTASQVDEVDNVFRKRVQSVQAVDAMVGRLEAAVAANDLAGDTYIVFSSDNGFHTGQYRLMPGKLTAYDSDIRVPLIVRGPGVPAGRNARQPAENIDLAPTFAALGGVTMRSDGHSLVRVLHGAPTPDWRDAALIEHHGPRWRITDPDRQHEPSGNPTTYEAMRTSQALYVEYKDGTREYYDLVSDPFELTNLAPRLSRAYRARLHSALLKLERCHGPDGCWQAMHTGGLTVGARSRLRGH